MAEATPKLLQKYLDKIQKDLKFYDEDCLNNPSDYCKKVYSESLKWSEARARFPKGPAIGDNTFTQVISTDGKYIKEARMFAAEVDGYPVGGVLASIDKERKIGYIWGLYVEGEFRKYELAHALVNRALKWLHGKGITELELVIKAGNEAALSFYRSMGFVTKSYHLRHRKSKYSDKSYASPHNRFK